MYCGAFHPKSALSAMLKIFAPGKLTNATTWAFSSFPGELLPKIFTSTPLSESFQNYFRWSTKSSHLM